MSVQPLPELDHLPETTRFRGVLPPEGREFSGLNRTPPSQADGLNHPGGLILNVLSPLRGELDAALARGDQARALRLAYTALSRVADALARSCGRGIGPEQVRIHTLLVQLAPLPFETQPDGTLREMGTQVEVNYRDWIVARAEADVWAARLTERFQSLWPGAWVTVSRGQESGVRSQGAGVKG
jgi:hypothetical protein